jgi:hypothetical protein
MRRKALRGHDWVPHDIADIGTERLVYFGAISLAWNMVEGAIDTGLALSLELFPGMWTEVTSRINGFDGKVAILKRACERQMYFPAEYSVVVADTFGLIEKCKQYRDAVLHVKMMDPAASVAPSFERRGETFEVLVTKDALMRLYDLIMAARVEADQIVQMLHHLVRQRGRVLPELSKDEKKSALRAAEECLVQLRSYQEKRKALPPLPEFPEEPASPPTSEAKKGPES